MGTQHQNIIEINGKKYDAVTGKMITGQSEPAKTTTVTPRQNTGVVDGFRRPAKSRQQAAHAKKSVQKSHTLMRTAVKKPAQTSKTRPAEPKIEKSHLGVLPSEKQTAEQTKKSPHISRFGDFQQRSSVIKKVQHLPVHKQSTQIHSVTTAVEGPAPVQVVATNHRSRATQALIEKALASANAHQQTPHHSVKKRRKTLHKLGISGRAMAASSGVLAAVLLAGFFAVQNVPNISMRVAAARAGFDASMPSYKPSGFAFSGPINYTQGQVTVSFKSNTDDRNYSVMQKESSWNSDALLSNYVVTNNKQYQTYLDRGRTLYIYDGSNATWVDNGVWYQIEGDSDLTTDQLVRIAASI